MSADHDTQPPPAGGEKVRLTKTQRELLREASVHRHSVCWPGRRRHRGAAAAERHGWLSYAGAGGYTITPAGRARTRWGGVMETIGRFATYFAFVFLVAIVAAVATHHLHIPDPVAWTFAGIMDAMFYMRVLYRKDTP